MIVEHENITIINIRPPPKPMRSQPDKPRNIRVKNTIFTFYFFIQIILLVGIVGWDRIEKQKELKDWEIKRAETFSEIRDLKVGTVSAESGNTYTIQNFHIDGDDYGEGTSAIEMDEDAIVYNMPTDGDYHFRIHIDDTAVTVSREGDNITIDGGAGND